MPLRLMFLLLERSSTIKSRNLTRLSIQPSSRLLLARNSFLRLTSLTSGAVHSLVRLFVSKLSISNWFMHLSLSICFIPSPQLRSSRWVSTLRLPNSLRMEFQSTLPQKLMLMHFTRVSDRMFSLRRLISFKLIYLSRNSLTRSSSSGRISLWSR